MFKVLAASVATVAAFLAGQGDSPTPEQKTERASVAPAVRSVAGAGFIHLAAAHVTQIDAMPVSQPVVIAPVVACQRPADQRIASRAPIVKRPVINRLRNRLRR